MSIEKYQTTIVVVLLVVATTILGYQGKMNPENVLFTLAGGIMGLSVPRKD